MEVFELQTRCEQLRGTIQSLESQLQQQKQLSPTSPRPRERGLGLREEGEGELFRCKFQGLGEVLAHNRETQEQLLKSQKENMRLRFEYEQAIVELPRLQVGGWVGGASHVTCQEYFDWLLLVYDCISISIFFRHRLRISRST